MTKQAVRVVIDLAAVVALLAVGVLGFANLFAGSAWILATAGALTCGVGVAILGWRLKWNVVTHVGVLIAIYFLTGGAFVLRSTTMSGIVPSLRTLKSLGEGAVTSWKDLLTVQVPTEGIEIVLLVPFIAVLIAAMSATALALRPRRPGWAVVPAAALLAVAIAFGTYQAVAPRAQALVFVAVWIAWMSYRRATRVNAASPDKASAGAARRVAFAAAVLGVSLAGGTLLASATAADGTREILRDDVVPPLELHDYASPLQSYRGIIRDQKEEVLFTVEGLPDGTNVRLATMDSYNGIVYAVSGDGSAVAGAFERVGSALPTTAKGDEATVTFTVGALDGVWVPTAGQVRTVTFAAGLDSKARTLHYNRSTSTAVLTAGLAEGDAYTMTVIIPAEPDATELADAALAPLPLPLVEEVPEGLRTLSSDATADATTALARVTALVTKLGGSGYFSHGLEGEAPSRSGHGSERIGLLVGEDQMIGDDEQYAVALSLMAHELGMPSRVVMGFTPPDGTTGPWEVTGNDLHVWTEIAFDGLGWIAFYPTPEEDRAPIDEEVPPEREPKPQVLQPPPPPQEPAEVPPAVPADDEAITPDDNVLEQVWRVALIVGGGLSVLAILFGPALAILVAKARRRRRRRRAADAADSLAAGWLEIADTATDYGVVLPVGATRVEKSRIVASALQGSDPVDLAQRADRHVWGPGEVSAAMASEYWKDVAHAISSIHKAKPLRARTAAKLSLRSLTKTAAKGGKKGAGERR